MHGRILFAAALVLAGCDTIFRLEEVSLPPPGDGGGSSDDGQAGDAVDAFFMSTAYISDGDYDGDAIENKSDPCPLDPAAATTDTDGDGLPDACDPDANGPNQRDCIVLFDTFVHPAPLDARWQEVPDWTVGGCDGGSETAYCSSRLTALSYAYFQQAYEVARVTVRVRLSNTLTPDNAIDDGFEVFATMEPANSDVNGVSCGLVRPNLSQSRVEINQHADTSVVTTAFSTNGATMVDDALLTLTWNPATAIRPHTCQQVGTAAEASWLDPPTDVGRYIAMRVKGINVNVHYLVAYGSTCPQ